MDETALVPRESEAGLDIAEFRARMEFEKDRIAAMKQFVSGQMVNGVHYGVIPGTGGKPTLLKPGAELLTNLHGIHPEFEETERVRDTSLVKHYVKQSGPRTVEGDCSGFVKYSYRCSLYRHGVKVGEGVGTCNNWEKKYLTVDVNDAENTVMKIAKKRSFIDATLTATRTSNFFTQDLEDIEIPIAPDAAAASDPDDAPEIPPHVQPTKAPATGAQGRVITEKQRARLWAIAYGSASKRNMDKKQASEFVKGLLASHGIDSTEDIPEERYDYIIERIQEWGNAK